MPVQNIAAKNSMLFLWATFPLLQEGLDTIAAWGFKYRTLGFNWVKRNKKASTWFWGMGNWTRANPEICLLGIRGSPRRQSASVHSIVDAWIMKHSQKPDEIRDRIRKLCGDVPRIELFARTRASGWDVWGNEV